MQAKLACLAENFWAGAQLTPGDVKSLADQGVSLVINNRPDGEAPGQPTSHEMEAAAKKAGLAYAFIPIDARGISQAHLDAFDHAMKENGYGLAIGYCRSGMRSAVLYAYAFARAGRAAPALIEDAAKAGYDIAAHRPVLETLNREAESKEQPS